MPIYEFRCTACATVFEALLAAGDAAPTCPDCGSVDVERKLSAPAAPAHLVKSPGEARKQESRNAALKARTKADFKARRQRARERAKGGS